MSWAHTHVERVRFGDLDAMKSPKLEFEMAVGERLIAEGHGILVGYDYESGQTVPLPDALKERLR